MQQFEEEINIGEVTENIFKTGKKHLIGKDYQKAVSCFDAALKTLEEYSEPTPKEEAKKIILKYLAIALDGLGRKYYRDGESQNTIDTFQRLLDLKTGLFRDNCYMYHALALEQFAVSFYRDGAVEKSQALIANAIDIIIKNIPVLSEYLLSKLSFLYDYLPRESAKFASLALGATHFKQSDEDQLHAQWPAMTKDRASTEQALVVFELILKNLKLNYPNNTFKLYITNPIVMPRFQKLVAETSKLRELQFIEEVIEVAKLIRFPLINPLAKLSTDLWLLILAYVAGDGLRTPEKVKGVCSFLLSTIRGTKQGSLNWSNTAKDSKFFKAWSANEFPRITSRQLSHTPNPEPQIVNTKMGS